MYSTKEYSGVNPVILGVSPSLKAPFTWWKSFLLNKPLKVGRRLWSLWWQLVEERFGLIKNTAVIWYIGHMPYFHLQTSLFSRSKDYRIWPWKKVVRKLL